MHSAMVVHARRILWPFLMKAGLCLLIILLAQMAPASSIFPEFRARSPPGRWDVLVQDAGIASMHSAVTHTDTVVLLDRRDGGRSGILLPGDRTVQGDPSAHSVVFTPAARNHPPSVRPLTILTDTWCSSGQFRADGTLVQTGGDLDDISGQTIRTFVPCQPGEFCDWVEDNTTYLSSGRWYATNQVLPDGETTIIVGGHRVANYEYIPKKAGPSSQTYELSVLQDADYDGLYPFVHLLPNGNLFIFTNQDSVLLDYVTNSVVRTFPTMPGNVARNYPATGSSVLLPLDSADGYSNATVLICGGTQPDASSSPNLLQIPASDTCGSLEVSKDYAQWSMFRMPRRRVMGDMVLLPTGDVLIINGAMNGSAGWEMAAEPCLDPVIFSPLGAAFEVQAAATRPRMYHSTANLLPDGRILVAGSNTHVHYTFNAEFPTDLTLEAFSPAYLANHNARPGFEGHVPTEHSYGETFSVNVNLPQIHTAVQRDGMSSFGLRLASAPFTTHSLSMGQRQLRLPINSATFNMGEGSNIVCTLVSTAPPSPNLAPPGYYMLFPLYDQIPGTAIWVRLGSSN